MTSASRPKARALRDPLYVLKTFIDFANDSPSANAFEQCSTTFRLLGDVPGPSHLILPVTPSTVMPSQGPGISPTPYVVPVTSTQGPGVPPSTSDVAPFTSTQGPGVSPSTSDVAPVTSTQGPGIPPTSYVAPVTSTQGLGVPPSTSDVALITSTQGQGAQSTASPSSKDNHSLPMSVSLERIQELRKKKYQHTQKKKPGVGISAAYVFSLHCISSDICLRNICAVDWCASHPEGTVGQFNLYWDNIDQNLCKVCLRRLYCTSQCSSFTYITRSMRKKKRQRGPK